MEINTDFAARTLVRFAETPWVGSPAPGSNARCSTGSAARWPAPPPSSVSPPAPPCRPYPRRGREYLVLEGTFQDEKRRLSPQAPTSATRPPRATPPPPPRAPRSSSSSTSSTPADRTPVTARTDEARLLFGQCRGGEVRIRILTPFEELRLDATGGAEILLLDGGITEGGDTLASWDWLAAARRHAPADRRPPRCQALDQGGHLAARPPPPPHSWTRAHRRRHNGDRATPEGTRWSTSPPSCLDQQVGKIDPIVRSLIRHGFLQAPDVPVGVPQPAGHDRHLTPLINPHLFHPPLPTSSTRASCGEQLDHIRSLSLTRGESTLDARATPSTASARCSRPPSWTGSRASACPLRAGKEGRPVRAHLRGQMAPRSCSGRSPRWPC